MPNLKRTLTAALLAGSLAAQTPPSVTPNLSVTLETAIADGRLVFVGKGGAIDGQVNPVLNAKPGDTVQITLLNGDGAQHDVAVPALNAKSEFITGKGTSSVLVFKVDKEGKFKYVCTVPGHEAAGMVGELIVGQVQASAPQRPSVARKPTDVPAPIGRRAPQKLRFDFETIEKEARLADGTTYKFWTFNGTVPGPMLRMRVGDTADVHLKNAANSAAPHSVDFHAVTGPGGGAVATQTQPGGETTFTFKALNPGLYVYHCATPMVAHHITNGMYGLILVEPEGGLPKVDKEFYVMQGELYTKEDFGQHGASNFDVKKLLSEQPEYFLFNGAVGALTTEHPMEADVGETVRIFFGVGGPNFTSSFHVIGEIFDKVYPEGDLTSTPHENIQTTLVPAGGAAVVEFKLDVPGRYILVDHSLSRLERGLAGYLYAKGPENPAVYQGTPTHGGGH